MKQYGLMPDIVGRMLTPSAESGGSPGALTFFTGIALGLNHVVDGGMPYAAATNGRELLENTEKLAAFSVAEQETVVAHECVHVAYGHCTLLAKGLPAGFVRELALLAFEYSVNATLAEANMPVPEGCVYSDRFPSTMSWIEVYDELKKIAEEQESQSGAEEDGGAEGSLGPEEDGGAEGSFGAEEDGGEGRAMTPEELVEEVMKKMKIEKEVMERLIEEAEKWEETPEEIQGVIRHAAQRAIGKGSMPGGLELLIEKLAAPPKADWRAILKSIINEVRLGDDDDDWAAMSIRQSQIWGRYCPSECGDGIERAVFAVDTSGSMYEDIKEVWPEITGMIMAAGEIDELHLMFCDCSDVQHIVVENAGPQSLPDLPPMSGYGGTSFVPVFEKVAELDQPPDIVVYFTDLMGTFPEDDSVPSCPVVWVTFSAADAPFGSTVHVEKGKEQ